MKTLFIIHARHYDHAACIQMLLGIAPSESIVVTSQDLEEAGGKLDQVKNLRSIRVSDSQYMHIREWYNAQQEDLLRDKVALHRKYYSESVQKS